jgi:hypothetical protein
MTIFVIKIIACITMVFDHIKYGLPITDCFITRYLGRISFPLYAFILTEGYIHTSDLKKYYKRLIIFALISQIPFMLFRTLVGEWKMLNIMFTLLLGLASITVYDKIDRKYISLPICIFIIYLGKVINVDYGWFGVASVFLFYVLKNKKYLIPFMYAILIFAYYKSINMFLLKKEIVLLYFIFTLLPSILILFYNGEKGRNTNKFYYWFYPVHMLVIYLISFIQ